MGPTSSGYPSRIESRQKVPDSLRQHGSGDMSTQGVKPQDTMFNQIHATAADNEIPFDKLPFHRANNGIQMARRGRQSSNPVRL
jgi:hypothetical protein